MAKDAVQSFADIQVWHRGRLPNGVIAEKGVLKDKFYGSREALIQAGYANPEWFPTHQVPGKRPGTMKSVFTYGAVVLTRRGSDRWEVAIPVLEEQKAARRAQQDALDEREKRKRQRRECVEEEQEEQTRRQRLRATLLTLPPFAPGSMSEGEKHHMRVMRGLDLDMRQHIFQLAELLLSRHLTERRRRAVLTFVGKLSTPLESAEDAHPRCLKLVVDNDGPVTR